MGNSFGKLFTITSFGESHGGYIGIVVDGCPAGLPLSEDDFRYDLERRRPGADAASTLRREKDEPEILSGVFNGFTTGAPVCFTVKNIEFNDDDYAEIHSRMRPGHADFTAHEKYGGFNDWRGGGRFSGRITVGFVMAGSIAKKILNNLGIEIIAHTVEIGGITAGKYDFSFIKQNISRENLFCADISAAMKMVEAINAAKAAGDSLGGIIEGIAVNIPVGLGEPVFDNLDGELAKALFAIPAVKGVEFGAGFGVARLKGSQNNDPFTIVDGKVVTTTNNSGGILGGISNGMPLVVKVAVKPTSSASVEQRTVDIDKMETATLEVGGRHDACIVPRAVPVVEAMIAVTLCDFTMRAGFIPRVIRQDR